MSYAELLERGDRIGALATGRCLVVVICENTVDCVTGYIGLVRAGVVVLMLHHTIGEDSLAAISCSFRPLFIYAPERLWTRCRPTGVICRNGAYGLLSTGLAADYPIHEELCLLLATSGTTGGRSFVRLSYRNVTSNASAIVEALAIPRSNRAITTMPMSYSYGLSILHSHLVCGASVVLTEASLVSPLFWRILKEHKVTHLGGVPFIYETLKKLRFDRMHLPDLHTLTQAGGRLGSATITEFVDICARKGCEFIVMYGQTEATARISIVPWAQARAKAGTIGIAIPGGALSLIDDRGAEVKDCGQVGELVYCGDNVCWGTAESWRDLGRGDDNQGRLLTGDLARRDEDGYFSIVGRKRRFLKIFGNRVHLDDLEAILKSCGLECACAGTDDRLFIYFVGDGDEKFIRAALDRHTTLTVHGVHIVKLGAFLRLESGKIDYPALTALAGRAPDA